MKNESSTSTLRDLDRTEDRIRLQRSVDKRPVLVVEGPSDLHILRPHLCDVQIYPADGKGGVLRAVRQLKSWGIDNAIAVVDRDFDDPAELDDILDAVHPYDGRDLEGMLIDMGVLALVLEHQGSREKIGAHQGSDAVISKLKKSVYPVTALRSANTENGFLLSFSSFDLAHKIDAETLDLLVEDYCLGLLANSETPASLEALLNVIVTYVDDGYGPRGKDVISAAGVALRKVIGNLPLPAAKEWLLTSQLHSSAGLAISQSQWLESLRKKLADQDNQQV